MRDGRGGGGLSLNGRGTTTKTDKTDEHIMSENKRQTRELISATTIGLTGVRYGVAYELTLGKQERGGECLYPALATPSNMERGDLARLLLGEKGEEELDAYLLKQVNAEMLRVWGMVHSAKNTDLQVLRDRCERADATAEDRAELVAAMESLFVRKVDNPHTRESVLTPAKQLVKINKRIVEIKGESQAAVKAFKAGEINEESLAALRLKLTSEAKELLVKQAEINAQEELDVLAAFDD